MDLLGKLRAADAATPNRWAALLGDGCPRVREAAVWALDGCAEHMTLVLRRLADPSAGVRAAASDVLAPHAEEVGG